MKKIIFANHAPKQRLSVSAILTVYRFNIGTPEGKAMYAALVADRAAAGVKPFTSHVYNPGLDDNHTKYNESLRAHVGMPNNALFDAPGGAFSAPVTIETKHIFDNQMSSAAPLNARLFDWSHNTYPNGNLVTGHYVVSPELQDLRATTCACGYCGAQYENGTPGEFCSQCIDGPHLDIATLHLLRLRLVRDDFRNAAPLTEEERAELLPIFEKARTEGITARGKARIAKQRADIIADYEKTIEKATIERDGKMWCNDNGIDTGLAIYYSHTKRWAFNWQEKLKGDELARLVEKVKTFPFAFDVK